MQFEITQRFTSPATDVEQAYADSALYPTLVGLPKLGGIEVIEEHDEPTAVELSIRFRFTGHLPGAVTAVVQPEKLTWVQRSRHEIGKRSATFVLEPDHYPDRLRAGGSFLVESSGSGALRIVRGELKVRAPLFAGRVENAIVSGLEEYLVAEAPAVDAWIAG